MKDMNPSPSDESRNLIRRPVKMNIYKRKSSRRKNAESFEPKKKRNATSIIANTSLGDLTLQMKPIGLDYKLNEMLSYLNGTEYSTIWLVGPAGIGKTTLLNEVKRSLHKCKNFTKVITVQVTKKVNVMSIQEQIAFQLKVNLMGLVILGTTTLRAVYLKSILSKETFLIILDDVWEKPDLGHIGIPLLKGRCKIVFATRLKGVARKECSQESEHNINFRMTGKGQQSKMVQLEYLNTEQSLELFTSAWGSKEHIYKEAVKKIVVKCGGLPLALVTVGKIAASQNNLEITDEALTKSPVQVPGMRENVFEVLKSSFDYLHDKLIRFCFIFCSLFSDFKDINKRRLFEYCLAEGCLKWESECSKYKTITWGSDGERIINELLDVCLLEEGRDEDHVRIHEMVRAMASWLATGGGGDQYQVKIHAGSHSDNSEVLVEKMKEVERASFIDMDIEKLTLVRLSSPYLKTLLMGLHDGRPEAQSKSLCYYQLIERENTTNVNSKRYYISNSFFGEMPNLCVVDMKGHPILHLPLSLCYLKSLTYLDLSLTFIQKIPREFAGLVSLRYLNLNHTPFLSSIPKEIMGGLCRLKSYKFYGTSYARIDEKGQMSVTDFGELRSLEELEVTIQEQQTFTKLLGTYNFPRFTKSLQVAFLDWDSGASLLEHLVDATVLRTLSIKSCQFGDEELNLVGIAAKLEALILQDLYQMTRITIPSSHDDYTYRIRKLHISQCSELEDLTCLCHLNNLEILEIEQCERMTQLLKEPHHSTTDCTHMDHKRCFARLRSLKLDHLPELTSVSHCRLLLDSLETVYVRECPELKKLPITVHGLSERKIFCEEKWWEGLEWEDNGVKNVFFAPIYFPHNDDKDAEQLGEVIAKLEARMSNLKIDTRREMRIIEGWKKIEQMKDFLSRGSHIKLDAYEVENYRKQMEALINTDRELQSEVEASDGEIENDLGEETRVKRTLAEDVDAAESHQGEAGHKKPKVTIEADSWETLVDPYPKSLHGDKLSEVVNYLTEKEKSIIMIVGAAGIGKTTFLLEAAMTAIRSHEFNDVIFIDTWTLTREGTNFIKQISDQIASQVLRLGDQYDNYDLFLLDDITQEPILSRIVKYLDIIRAKYMIVITTRLDCNHLGEYGETVKTIEQLYTNRIAQHAKEVTQLDSNLHGNRDEMATWLKACKRKLARRMSSANIVVHCVRLKCLDQYSSWQFFLNVAQADEAAMEDMGIGQVAREMVERCGGLPLALSVVGREARHWSSCADWHSARETMTSSPVHIPGMENWVFDIIKSHLYSLSSDQKSCLSLCALFQNEQLYKDQLIAYMIGEDQIFNQKEGEKILAELTDVSLLEEVDEQLLAIQSMVHRTICRLGEIPCNPLSEVDCSMFIDSGLGDIDILVQIISRAKRASIKANRMNQLKNEDFHFTLLETLFIESSTYLDPTIRFSLDGMLMHQAMQESRKSERDSILNSHTEVIHDTFFGGMPQLAVLDMTRLPVVHLPKSVFDLALLSCLNLSWTLIQELPVELRVLSKLRSLDLSFTEFLSSIPREAIVGLKKLRTLKLYCSGYRRFGDEDQITWDDLFQSQILETIELPYMEDFSSCNIWHSIKRLSLDHTMRLDSATFCSLLQEVQGMKALSIRSCQGLDGELVVNKMDTNILVLCDLQVSKITLSLFIHYRLRELHIYRCGEFSTLDCLCMLQELRVFGMYECTAITRLIQLSHNSYHKSHNMPCLPQLKNLTLQSLPSLESMSDCFLHLQSVVHFRVTGCPKLKKIPLLPEKKAKSITIQCTREWWGELEWDVHKIKSVFIPEFLDDMVPTKLEIEPTSILQTSSVDRLEQSIESSSFSTTSKPSI